MMSHPAPRVSDKTNEAKTEVVTPVAAVTQTASADPTDRVVLLESRLAALEKIVRALREENAALRQQQDGTLKQSPAQEVLKLTPDQIFAIFEEEKPTKLAEIKSEHLKRQIEASGTVKQFALSTSYQKVLDGRPMDVCLIFLATQKGCVPFFRFLASHNLLTNGDDSSLLEVPIDPRDNAPMLSTAVFYSQLVLVKFLLECGATLDRRYKQNKFSYPLGNVLRHAISDKDTPQKLHHKNREMGNYLLMCGAAVTDQTRKLFVQSKLVESATQFIIKRIQKTEEFLPHELGWTNNKDLEPEIEKHVFETYLKRERIAADMSVQAQPTALIPASDSSPAVAGVAEQKAASSPTEEQVTQEYQRRMAYVIKNFGKWFVMNRCWVYTDILEVFDSPDDSPHKVALFELLNYFTDEQKKAFITNTRIYPSGSDTTTLLLCGSEGFFRWAAEKTVFLDKDNPSNLLERSSCNKYKPTPLLTASHYGRIEVVTILIAHGANIQYRDSQGYSALDHCLVNAKNIRLGAYLLRCGVPCKVENQESQLYRDCVTQAIEDIKSTITQQKEFKAHEIRWLQDSSLREVVASFCATEFLNPLFMSVNLIAATVVQRSLAAPTSAAAAAEEKDSAMAPDAVKQNILAQSKARVGYLKTLGLLGYSTIIHKIVDAAANSSEDEDTARIHYINLIALLLLEGAQFEPFEFQTSEQQRCFTQGVIKALVMIGEKLRLGHILSGDETRFIEGKIAQNCLQQCLQPSQVIANFGPKGLCPAKDLNLDPVILSLEELGVTPDALDENDVTLLKAFEYFKALYATLKDSLPVSSEPLTVRRTEVALSELTQRNLDDKVDAFIKSDEKEEIKKDESLKLLKGRARLNEKIILPLGNGISIEIEGDKFLIFYLCVIGDLIRIQRLTLDERATAGEMSCAKVEQREGSTENGRVTITPLGIAFLRGQVELFDYLLAKNRDASITQDLFYWAALSRDPAKVHFLLSYGLTVEMSQRKITKLSSDDSTFLTKAIKESGPPVARLFLERLFNGEEIAYSAGQKAAMRECLLQEYLIDHDTSSLTGKLDKLTAALGQIITPAPTRRQSVAADERGDERAEEAEESARESSTTTSSATEAAASAAAPANAGAALSPLARLLQEDSSATTSRFRLFQKKPFLQQLQSLIERQQKELQHQLTLEGEATELRAPAPRAGAGPAAST